MLCNIYGIIELTATIEKGRPLSAHESEIENRRAHTHTMHAYVSILIAYYNIYTEMILHIFLKKVRSLPLSASGLSPYARSLVCKQIENGHIFSIFHVHHSTVSHTVIHYNDSFFPEFSNISREKK